MSRLKKIRIVEFLVIGLLMGMAEDLIAIAFATESTINPKIILVVFLVALPFAFISEVVVDHPRFWEKIWPPKKEGNKIT